MICYRLIDSNFGNVSCVVFLCTVGAVVSCCVVGADNPEPSISQPFLMEDTRISKNKSPYSETLHRNNHRRRIKYISKCKKYKLNNKNNNNNGPSILCMLKSNPVATAATKSTIANPSANAASHRTVFRTDNEQVAAITLVKTPCTLASAIPSYSSWPLPADAATLMTTPSSTTTAVALTTAALSVSTTAIFQMSASLAPTTADFIRNQIQTEMKAQQTPADTTTPLNQEKILQAQLETQTNTQSQPQYQAQETR